MSQEVAIKSPMTSMVGLVLTMTMIMIINKVGAVRAIETVDQVKVALAPLDGLMKNLNNCSICNPPSIGELDRAHELIHQVDGSIADKCLWDEKELKWFRNLKNLVLVNWDSSKMKMNLSYVIKARANRVMLQLVEKYHIARCDYSACSEMVIAPLIEGIRAGSGPGLGNLGAAINMMQQPINV